MTPITAIEQAAYAQMQARLVELLLRHDERRFRQLYGQHSQYAGAEHDVLKRYRNLATLFHLRDALFDDILPRIVRRLSFESPRTMLVEEPPAQGRIDWERTLNAVWDERPGEPPLLLHTRQRRRKFTTPENLLTVVTLLEYGAAVQEILWNEHATVGGAALRHPLNEIVERCERELAFPQFAGLRQAAQRRIDGAGDDVETIEAQVRDRLTPASNSAYQDLLDWRARLRELQLLERTTAAADDVLGADPRRDNYLYQLWLFYEIGAFLQQRERLIRWDQGAMTLRFTWGDGDDRRDYVLQHDQTIKLPNGRAWQPWLNAPGVRPDLYIQHADAHTVINQDVPAHASDHLLWREPGYVLDAKYYQPRDSSRAPASPVKRMIADLQLSDERAGALLFAFQQATEDSTNLLAEELGPDGATAPQSTAPLYNVTPVSTTAQHTQPDVAVAIWRIQPVLSGDSQSLHDLLGSVLERAHQAIKQRVAVRCHGVFLDSLTATAHGALATINALRHRDGSPVTEPLDDLLICPKPHVAAWRVDLVSHTHDCCKNGAVCHIKFDPQARKPRRLMVLDDITSAIRAVDEPSDDAQVTSAATTQVLAITKRYAELLQPNIAEYQAWIRNALDLGDLLETTSLLTETHGETLALARFLWEQIDHIRATNYAGPTLLFTGVLEEIIRHTIFQRSGTLYRADGHPLPDTLGTVGHSIKHGGQNFALLEQRIVQQGYWNGQITTSQMLSLRDWIERILKISFIRNDAAHRANVTPQQFRSLIETYFGSPRHGIGVLSGLLLAWQSPIGPAGEHPSE